VNNNDIVTRVPPVGCGIATTGSRCTSAGTGELERLSAEQRGKDRCAGFWSGLEQRKFDHFGDHAIASAAAD